MNAELDADEHTRVEQARLEARDLGLVIVRLGDDARFGLDISAVVEVVPLRNVTPLFGLREHILGITNLRGRIVPVSDLAAVLGLAAASQHSDPTFDQEDETRVGLLVRFERREAVFVVSEVIAVDWISSLSLTDVPSTTSPETRGFFRGIAPATPSKQAESRTAGCPRRACPVTILATDHLLSPEVWPMKEGAGAER